MSTTENVFKQEVVDQNLGELAVVTAYRDADWPELYHIVIETPDGRRLTYEIDRSFDRDHSHDVVHASFAGRPYRIERPTQMSGLYYIAECGHVSCEEMVQEDLAETVAIGEWCCGELDCQHVWPIWCREQRVAPLP